MTFKPNVHGWPFGNSFEYTVPFKKKPLKLGFCGGMCWSALDRYNKSAPIDRSTKRPKEGSPLYEEIWRLQCSSVTVSKLTKMLEWQSSPDLSHKLNPLHSLGHRTKQAWPAVQAVLDQKAPVTITLIGASNTSDPLQLMKSHRVIAYSYTMREGLLPNEWVHGKKKPGIRRADIQIYDPNRPDEDVSIYFYFGCDDNWIGLTHSNGPKYHGLFKDNP